MAGHEILQRYCCLVFHGKCNVVLQRPGVSPVGDIPLPQALQENLLEALTGLSQAPGRWMRDPIGKDEGEQAANVSLHCMQKVKKLQRIVFVEVVTHERTDYDLMDEERDAVEELKVLFLFPLDGRLASLLLRHGRGICLGRAATDISTE